MKDCVITDIRMVEGLPLISREDAPTVLRCCKSTAESRLREFKEFNDSRYNGYGYIKDGGIIRYNFLALMDFLKYRNFLMNPNRIKYVPDYEPKKIKESFGMYIPFADCEGR